MADFLPELRLHLVATSALLWLVAALTWSVRAIPKIFIPDPEP